MTRARPDVAPSNTVLRVHADTYTLTLNRALPSYRHANVPKLGPTSYLLLLFLTDEAKEGRLIHRTCEICHEIGVKSETLIRSLVRLAQHGYIGLTYPEQDGGEFVDVEVRYK
jgi:hypothetical protein